MHRNVQVLLLSSGLGLALPAGAQELEEIVVTAMKREQSLQDAPISIVAVTGQELRGIGMERLADAALYVPNLKISTSDGSAKNINMRGLGSGNNRGFETSVGLFLDGIYLGRETFVTDAFVDLNRIEVIRGPQGALFGKNTIAGAVSLVSEAPSAGPTGLLSGTVGNFDQYIGEAMVSGPISDTLSGRLYLQSFDRGGMYRNTFNGDRDGTRDVQSVRARLYWEPTERFDASLTLQYADFDAEGMSRQLVESVPCRAIGTVAGCTAPGVSSPFSAGGTLSTVDVARTRDPFAEGIPDTRLSVGPQRPGESRVTKFLASTMNYQIGQYTLTYVGGLAAIDDQITLLDADTTPLDINFLTTGEDYSQVSHELRVSSPAEDTVSFIAGLYYFKSDVDGFQFLTVRSPFPGPPQGEVRSRADQATDSRSVFGQATWSVSPRTRLIAGLRYIEEDKDSFISQSRDPTLFIFPNYGTTAGFSDDATLLNGTIEFDIQDDVMAYASYNEGFKAGGINFFSLNGTNFTYDSETSEGFEIGLKSKWLDGRAILNVAVFSTEFDNLQTASLNNNVVVVANAATAESKGIEAEFAWQVTSQLRTQIAAAYLDAGFTDYRNAPCTARQIVNTVGACSQDLSNGGLEGAPRFSGAWRLNYVVPLPGFGSELTFGADVLFSDEYFLFGSGDNDPLDVQPSWVKYNARVSLGSEDGRWSVALVGKNLGDRQTGYSGLDAFQFPGSRFLQMDPPRQFEAQFTYRWK